MCESGCLLSLSWMHPERVRRRRFSCRHWKNDGLCCPGMLPADHPGFSARYFDNKIAGCMLMPPSQVSEHFLQ